MNHFTKQLLIKRKPCVTYSSVRWNFLSGIKGPVKGKDPPQAISIRQHLEKLQEKDETIHYKVDIGFPYLEANKQVLAERNTFLRMRNSDKQLGRLSRNNKLDVSLEDSYDEWQRTSGPKFVRRIAEHYGIFEHLFGDAYFHPITPLRISFKSKEDEYTPVYFGNSVKPKEASNEPIVDIGNKSDVLHTLALTNVDGHLNKPDGEYVHWMIGNIPNGDVTKGEIVCSYLKPFPTKGTGYHRYIFVLYQHDSKLDFTDLKKGKPSSPDCRNFSTYEFYRDRQDKMTPSGLLFFQTDWDSSVTEVFHEIFSMPEPRFEYDFEEQYTNPQMWFPKRRIPFNTYMDRYRDPKQISKEVLVKKLKNHHPFTKPDPPLKYPAIHTPHDHGDKASWIQVEVKKERLGWGKIYNDNKDIIDPK